MTPTRGITACVQQLKLFLSVENNYQHSTSADDECVWNSRNDQREKKKKNREKETRRRTRSNQFACFG
jgi:hypothetical protein